MAESELQRGYEAYIGRIGRFYDMEKIELALLLARLCVLHPEVPQIIRREQPAVSIVKDYALSQIKEDEEATDADDEKGQTEGEAA